MAPLAKRRKTTSAVEEVKYDPVARQEYLSGFRKRKQQRIKQAQQTAKEKDRLQRIEDRKTIREQRRKELEEHLQAVNDMVKKAESGQLDSDEDVEDGDNSGGGEGDHKVASLNADADGTASDQEYVDEEKFTTVTIEPMSTGGGDDGVDESSRAAAEPSSEPPGASKQQKRVWTKKKPDAKKVKKKKFRYETKSERKATNLHQRAKNAKAAEARRRNE